MVLGAASQDKQARAGLLYLCLVLAGSYVSAWFWLAVMSLLGSGWQLCLLPATMA
jgi:hypothetical protein